MAKQTEFEHPPAGHVGLLAYDAADDHWHAVYVDDSGNLQVDVVSSGLPSDAATETTLAAILAAMVRGATTPTVYNVTMTNAATEYSQALPSGCRKFTVQCRGAYDVKLCYTNGGSGTTYITVKKGCSYWEDHINATSKTLYFQCATAGQVLEIVAWT